MGSREYLQTSRALARLRRRDARRELPCRGSAQERARLLLRSRPQRASREIRAGCVWINDHIPIISEMPHGGVGASGFGKDMSDYSFEEYLTIKHVMSDITAHAEKDWHRIIFSKR